MVSGKTGETTLTLTADDAHAWAEYYEDGVGWIPFETATPYLNVMAESDWRWFQPDNDADLTGAQAQDGGGNQNSMVRHSTVEIPDQTADQPQVITIWKELSSTLRSSLSRLHVGRWLLLLLALALLAAILFVVLRRHRTCKRRAAAFDGADRAAATAALFAYAMELMWHGGLPRENGSLLQQDKAVSDWAGKPVDFPALVWLNAEARYSSHPITETQRSQMRYFADDTLRCFRRKLKLWQKLYQKWILCMY